MARRNHPELGLMDLPEPIIMDISVRVARASLLDTRSLGLVCRVLNANYQSEEVLSECSLVDAPLFPTFEDPEEEVKYELFLERLRANGNGEALYRMGIFNFFDPRRYERREEGLDQLTRSADKGIPRAVYALGLALICTGGERRQEGYERLATLMKPSLSETIEEVAFMMRQLKGTLVWRCGRQTEDMLDGFVHGPCECESNGDDTMLFLKFANVFETELGEADRGDICQICFWYREAVYLFSDNAKRFDNRL